jgi:hypothetical protein
MAVMSALGTSRQEDPSYSFLLEAESTFRPTVRPEDLNKLKILMTLPGIETEIFRLVG